MPRTDDQPAEALVNILLVDDLPTNLLALTAVLQDLGQNLVQAHSGEEALRLLRSDDFGVVLLDVQMPGMDGYETARRIRRQERFRHTPIIFLTAYESTTFSVTQAYELGAVDYLVKPLVPVILRAKVAGFVELFRQKEQIQRQSEQLRLLERQQFEHQLVERARQEEQRFRLIAENVRDYAIFILDTQGRIVTWNRGAERILGHRDQEIIGQPISRLFTPDDIAAGRPERELREATQTGRASDDNWLVRHDGSRLWANGVTTALVQNGDLQGFVKILRDLTEMKRLEDRLRQQAADLAEADRRKDAFLAMLAHELRNPLVPIRNAVHILKFRGGDWKTVEQVRELLDRQVQHLVRLVDDLLDESRITQGKISLRIERLDLGGIVRQCAEDHRAAIEAAGLTLFLEVPETRVWVWGDATRLTQVFENLLVNAQKFTDRGGAITLRMATDAATQRAIVSVRDTGVGIDAAMLPRLFEVFVQAERSLDRSRGGLGLGLAIVKGLVELHGGTIQAASPGVGQGTEFTLTFPHAGEDDALSKSPVSAAPRQKNLRVLVIEDNRDAAHSLRLLLELSGCQVVLAASGWEGIEVARQTHPDVIVCDIGIPGMDGYAVAQSLRGSPETAAIRLIAVTGYGQEEDRRRALSAGFDAHLVKPVDPDQLLSYLDPDNGSTEESR